MDTLLLYAAAIAGLAVSFLKNKKKTGTAVKKAWKSFSGILPQFLGILFLVAAALAVLDTAAISRFLCSESALGYSRSLLVGAVTLHTRLRGLPAASTLLKRAPHHTDIGLCIELMMVVSGRFRWR